MRHRQPLKNLASVGRAPVRVEDVAKSLDQLADILGIDKADPLTLHGAYDVRTEIGRVADDTLLNKKPLAVRIGKKIFPARQPRP